MPLQPAAFGCLYLLLLSVSHSTSRLFPFKLPLTLLNVSTGSPLLVELKGGDTYNGRLVSCDSWMNMNLTDVICTSKDGDRFWKLPSCYIRGSAIKYLRLPPELFEKANGPGVFQSTAGSCPYYLRWEASPSRNQPTV